MKIAILETGRPPEPLQAEHGSYPDMIVRLTRASGLEPAAIRVFDVQAGELPAQADAYDACFVMGSPAGVYDDHAWIGELKDFLNQAKGKTKLVGVCFGHQVMAEAFGGRVEKSAKGWGVGLHAYEVRTRQAWMGEDEAPLIRVPVSHQDQVVVRPPNATVLANSGFSEFGALVYEDQPAISFQCHPEFTPAYAAALAERRRGTALADHQVDAAVESLQAPNDNARVGRWIVNFLKG